MKQIEIIPESLSLPAVVSGCMRIAELETAQVEALVHTALENGITMFDHADIYGGGQSEALFGKVLAGSPGLRDQMVLQSKCGIGQGLYDASQKHILAATEGILSRLGIEQLDILLLHRPDALMEPEEVAAAFAQLEKQGKVRYFGVSNQNAAQMALLQHTLPMPIHFNQMQFSLKHTEMVDVGISVNTGFEGAVDKTGDVLDYCRLHRITLQTWSPFQYGFFEGPFVDNPKFPELNAELRRMAGLHGVSPSAVAVAWILRHPAQMQVIVGTTNKERLADVAVASHVKLNREEWYALYRAAGNTLP